MQAGFKIPLYRILWHLCMSLCWADVFEHHHSAPNIKDEHKRLLQQINELQASSVQRNVDHRPPVVQLSCHGLASCPASMANAPGLILTFSTGESPDMTARAHGSTLDPSFADDLGFSAVAVGAGGSSLAIEADGSLWTWGRNSSDGGGGHGSQPLQDAGQLGYPRSISGGPIRKVLRDIKFIAADAGRYHMAGIADDGRLYTWGLNDFGQLGRSARDATMQPCTSGDFCHDPALLPVSDIAEQFVAVAAGRYHTVAATASGVVYTTGLNFCGNGQRLEEAMKEGVLPNTKHLARLTQVHGFDPADPIVQLSAGYTVWLALTRSGQVYTCATGFDGYAGTLPASRYHGGWAGVNKEGFLGVQNVPDAPEGLVPHLLPDLQAQSVAASRYGAALVSTSGVVYTWGASPLGRIGSGSIPGPVTSLQGINIDRLCMGEYHAVALSEDGNVYVWGAIRANQDTVYAGIDLHKAAAPLHAFPEEYRAMAASCGYQHTVFIAAPKVQKLDGDQSKSDQGEHKVPAGLSDADHHEIGSSANRGEAWKGGKPLDASLAGTEQDDMSEFPQTHTEPLPPHQVDKPFASDYFEPANRVDSGAIMPMQGHSNLCQEDADLPAAVPEVMKKPPEVPSQEPDNTSVPGLGAAVEWDVEDCGQGRTRPRWVESCETLPQSIHALDTAWYGMYKRPSMDIVRLRNLVQQAAEDVFEDVLYPWLPSARSPCWLDLWGDVKCLPFLSIIGVSKSGTTDLYQKLMKLRPFVDSHQKGLHFWDEKHEWYEQTELYKPISDRLAANPDVYIEDIMVDASSNTFSTSGVGIRVLRRHLVQRGYNQLQLHWRPCRISPLKCLEMIGWGSQGVSASDGDTCSIQVTVATVLKEVQPDGRILVLMRDPVARMYSAFWYYGCRYDIYKKYGMTADGFHEFAAKEVSVLNQCLDKGSSIRECARTLFYTAQQLIKGIYAAFAPDWLAAYPANQVMWVRSEDYFANPEHHIQSLLKWLEVPVPSTEDMKQSLATSANRGHDGKSKVQGCDVKSPSMRPDTLKLLQEFYAPWNQLLAVQLGPKFTWQYSSDSGTS